MGTYTNKVDAKSRVSVPAEFRAILAEDEFDGLIYFPSFTDTCLEAGGPTYFEDLQGMIDALDPYDEVREAFEVAIIGEIQKLFFDKEGRITLTGAFTKHADIDEYVTFVGRGDHFQMWNPALYETFRDRARTMARENRALLRRPRKPAKDE